MNVIAVVVTHNRLHLLKRTIDSLRQNAPIGTIVVVDNGCTDGTAEWLDSQANLDVLHQGNVGGSGGFHTGMKRAYDLGADWIWCMDDDVFPRPDCLEKLLLHTSEIGKAGILAPRRLIDGEVYTNDFREYNFLNPLASTYRKKLKDEVINEPTEIAGTAFEGLFVSRKVVGEVGLPLKDLFILCDDTEYCLRTWLLGFRLLYIPDALMDKQRFYSDDSWSERNRKKKWKRFYHVRNSTFLNHHYGRNWSVRYLRSFFGVVGIIATAFFTAPFSQAYDFSDIPKLWQAYRDGLNEKLGKYE